MVQFLYIKMNKIYFDNAATTALHPLVKEEMIRALDVYGNPSSTHETGRKAKIEIERVRKLIAATLHGQPGEIFFTAGGTEANNLAIFCAVRDLGVKHIITTSIEHHAVTHPVEYLEQKGEVRVTWLSINPQGEIKLNELEKALQTDDKTLVSIMSANNEIGNINPVPEIADLVHRYNAYFHTDAVQAVAHIPINLETTPIHFLSSSAHKYHGPKGIGFCYVRGGVKIHPQIMGGAQERNMRAGTENLTGIIGMGKAFELAYQNLDEDKKYILGLKKYAIERFQETLPEAIFFGKSGQLDASLFTVLNIGLPKNPSIGMLTFTLDINGIAASGGSACNSGSSKGSHVIAALGEVSEKYLPLRISFSKFNTMQEIDVLINVLKEVFQPIQANA